MCRLKVIAILLVFSFSTLFANGVCIVDAHDGAWLRLQSTRVSVVVESQIATITTTQIFVNDLSGDRTVKYAFPLMEQSSAIDLRWEIYGEWHMAEITGTPPDTSLPGGGDGVDPNLSSYLGSTPISFEIPQQVKKDSIILVQLTYVELLPYEFGNVDFLYANDYSLIQNEQLQYQELLFELSSLRAITSIQMLSGHPLTQVFNDGENAFLHSIQYEDYADEDFQVRYALNLDELGLFGFSTSLIDSTVPDEHGSGFFTFIAEPDPSETSEVIDKVFTLIIDRSGSMSGQKIVQARDAASFIVENLNEGDKFNIVDFASGVTSFSNEHLLFTEQSEQQALSYIGAINASGSTNISGAFGVAVPQFDAANNNTANIIIFFTDGMPTAGITHTETLVGYITDLVEDTETGVQIFTFGIGESVGERLLTLIAAENDGLAEFLGDDELFERITDFYLRIRNPVLLNTGISFSPAVISEVYPNPLPNLYIGQQMIVSGRYSMGSPVTVTLSGTAFGQNVSYDYALDLSDSTVSTYQFLPKIWAKQKIEKLLIDYFVLDEDSPEAEALKEEIIAISVAYGIISPFTSFSGDDPVTGIEEEDTRVSAAGPVRTFELLGNYPNPFNPTTTIRMQVNTLYVGPLQIRIYDALGRLVRILAIDISGQGIYEVMWDGLAADGSAVASGNFFYIVELENTILVGKMTLIK